MNKMQTYPDRSEPSTSIDTKGLFSLSIWKLIGIATIILFLYSSLRHFLFQSTAYDLGIYDQIIYLMSQGSQPISSFLGFHFLGDHGALAIYPLVFLYKLYPTVYWLFLVQAVCLASAGGITWKLARLSGLNQPLALAVAIAYLLYPEIFNINLFDFHPDVLAVPALFGAVLAAKQKQFLWFLVAILWILSCKAVFSLTVIAIGFWLIFFEQRRFSGMIAIALGIAWFLLVTQIMIPFYSGQEAAGVSRYPYLGNSVLEVIANTLVKPQLIIGKLFSIDSLVYLLELSVAVIWWLNPQKFMALIPAIPTLLLNILSIDPMQRSLIYQYSLPALPFLFLVMIRTLAAEKPGLGNGLWRLWNQFQKNTPPYPPLLREGKEAGENISSHPPFPPEEIEHQSSSSHPPFSPEEIEHQSSSSHPPLVRGELAGESSSSHPPFPPEEIEHQSSSSHPPFPPEEIEHQSSSSHPPFPPEEIEHQSSSSHPPLVRGGRGGFSSHLFTIPHPKLPQWIVLWSSLIFLLWGDHTQVLGYFTRIDNWSATRNAVAEIQTQGGVLTDNRLAPHFTHRQTIKLLNQVSPDFDLKEFDYVILNLRHPWPDTKDLGEKYTQQLKQKSNFKLSYQQNDVLVFKRISGGLNNTTGS